MIENMICPCKWNASHVCLLHNHCAHVHAYWYAEFERRKAAK